MSSTVILIYICCLINLSWCTPTTMDSMNVTIGNFMASTTIGSDPSTIRPNESESIQPNVTINLNCSCIITTPNARGSKVATHGLIVNGQSDYRCNQKAFKDCKTTCLEKMKNAPIFNVDSRSVSLESPQGVNLNDYLCGLLDKGDLSSTVSITTQMDCTEKSTTFELFNSQSHSFIMSPSTSLDCPTTTSIAMTTPAEPTGHINN